MQPFEYLAPTTLAEARELLKTPASGETRILAGGTDLIVQMRGGARQPARVLDIKWLPESQRLQLDTDAIYIGAGVPAAVLCEHPELRTEYPGVVEAIELIGSMQVQGRATAVGNLCNASPAADSVPALFAAGAAARVVGAAGERWVPVEDIPTGPGKTSLAADEFVIELKLPRMPARAADAYQRFTPRAEMDIAVVGVGICLSLDNAGLVTAARAAICAVAPTVLLAPEVAEVLVGTRCDAAVLEEAGARASAMGNPLTDKRGTSTFRRHIAGVLTQRVAGVAYQRASQPGVAA